MLFMNGRRLAQICVSFLHVCGYLNGNIRINDQSAIARWMLYDMLPMARQYFTDDELAMLEEDRSYYLHEMSLREKGKQEGSEMSWHGDFVHEIMNWFERSYLDGWKYDEVHDRFGRSYKCKIYDYKIFVCPITDDKATEILQTALQTESVMAFCRDVLVKTLPSLVNCFEMI